MKKTYSKPEIVFESFKISSNIAVGSSCDEGYRVNSTANTCYYSYNDVTLFGTDNGSCLFKGDESDTCYDVPLSGIVMFNS